ncbi:FkbM family methyltransferase [Rhodopirellula sallentina]|uniref:FkbM family methyltransferase n=1 Tax=Rhodopirellula sallentina TaxID=1263869 RepID=UPI0005C7BC6D|nr:FkbM family methyltransferase [Rhodopirellula sallentina]
MLKRSLRKLLTPWMWGLSAAELGMGQRTWSQFGEDMVIPGFFPEKYVGVYVDVGAFHPIYLSNTYKLYRHGWSGLAIDANPDFQHLYARFRSRDSFLCSAVSDSPGTLRLSRYKFGAFNCLEEHSHKVPDKFQDVVDSIEVPSDTLANLLERSSFAHIDVLNIDCEGSDLKILQSNDWSRWLPKVVCVEDHSEIWQSSQTATFMDSLGYKIHHRVGLTTIFAETKTAEKRTGKAFHNAETTNSR